MALVARARGGHALRNGKPTAPQQAAALIIAGGRGTRFWPESRAGRPKPLFSFDGANSLLAATVERTNPLISRERIFVLVSADQVGAFRPAVKGLIPSRNLIVEPAGRGTAVAIAYGTAIIAKRFGDETADCGLGAQQHQACRVI